MRIIGLTGGVGTGKSTVSQFLQEMGAVLLDADKIGHESYLPGSPAWKDLIAAFGEGILQEDRSIDRKKLGAVVFGNPDALKTLNGIVHPRMRDMIKGKLEALRARGTPVVVLEAAILFETGWDALVDEKWVTDAPEETVIRRVKNRNNWSEEQIRGRIKAQMPRQERCARATVVVDTDCTLDEVRAKVRALWEKRVGAVS